MLTKYSFSFTHIFLCYQTLENKKNYLYTKFSIKTNGALASYLSFTLFLVGFICGGVGNLNILSKVIGYIIPPLSQSNYPTYKILFYIRGYIILHSHRVDLNPYVYIPVIQNSTS